jgi:hypothetical protein
LPRSPAGERIACDPINGKPRKGKTVAYASFQEFEATEDRSTPTYDAVNERLGDAPPEGAIVHMAGFSDDGVFRIITVWESREQLEAFERDRLMPILEELGDQAGQPAKQEVFELHNFETR